MQDDSNGLNHKTVIVQSVHTKTTRGWFGVELSNKDSIKRVYAKLGEPLTANLA